MAFVDAHRATYGVESICATLPIAPASYYRHGAARRDPARRCARRQQDDRLAADIQRVWDDNHQVYGAEKVWRALKREGQACALNASAIVRIASSQRAHSAP